jgi:hypothetical protein
VADVGGEELGLEQEGGGGDQVVAGAGDLLNLII